MTPEVTKFMLVLLRVTGLVWAGPVTGSPAVPPLVKAGLCLVLSIVAYTGATAPAGGTIAAYLGELFFGMAAGFTARLMVESMAVAGEIWDIQAGLSMANLLDPASGASVTLLGTLGAVAGAVVFLSAGGLDVLVGGLLASFKAVPPGGVVDLAGAADLAVRGVPAFFALVGSIALPAVIILLLLDLTLAVMGRTAPQLNIFSVGFAVRMAALFVSLLFALPHVVEVFAGRVLRWVLEIFLV